MGKPARGRAYHPTSPTAQAKHGSPPGQIWGWFSLRPTRRELRHIAGLLRPGGSLIAQEALNGAETSHLLLDVFGFHPLAVEDAEHFHQRAESG